MAARKRETEEEKALRERQERIELLKMKQGLIEESEVIPEKGYVEIPELHGWSKFSNFIYHNKWWMIITAFFAFVIGICVYQFVTREKYDLYVLLVSAEEKSEIGWRQKDIEKALEMYCPDFDGNGKVNVVVNYINRAVDDYSEYGMSQIQKLTIELSNGEGQLFVTEEKLWDYLYPDGNGDGKAIVSFEDELDEDMLFNGRLIRLNKTELPAAMRWRSCPDNVCIFLRNASVMGMGDKKAIAESNRRAAEVLQNILDGNMVNPPET